MFWGGDEGPVVAMAELLFIHWCWTLEATVTHYHLSRQRLLLRDRLISMFQSQYDISVTPVVCIRFQWLQLLRLLASRLAYFF